MTIVSRPESLRDAADPRLEALFVARGALKRAMQARDAARSAHVAAQQSVDELRALVQRLEAGARASA